MVRISMNNSFTRSSSQSYMYLLFRLSHSNVVQYRLGVCFLPDSKYPALVVEQLQTSLHDYLFHSHTDLFADH